MTTSRDIDLARARTSYLLRGLWRRVDWSRVADRRRRGLASELAEQLYPCAISERSTLGWLRAVANRFEIDLTPGERQTHAAYAEIPSRFVDAATMSDVAPPPAAPGGSAPELVRVRWDVMAQHIEFAALRMMLHDGAPMIATFATAEPTLGEDTMFPIAEAVDRGGWQPVVPENLITPRALRTVWTLVGPMHHGHDEKTGNVSLFRRHRVIDPTTGRAHLVPFVSGNSIRGMWRDMVFGRLLGLVGLTFAEMAPRRAHALLAGGTIAAGTDTAKVDVGQRRRARAICPAWDLLGGTIDGQLMGGVISVHDAVVVCRESAWMLRHQLAADVQLDEFRASLKPADELTQLRLLTRHAHRDIPDAGDMQMFVNTEALLPGTQLFHSLAVHGIEAVSPITKACLADLLETFALRGHVGAKTAAGHGIVAFDAYTSSDGALLPPAAEYVDWVNTHRVEVREWLLAGAVEALSAPAAPKPSKGRRSSASAES